MFLVSCRQVLAAFVLQGLKANHILICDAIEQGIYSNLDEM